MVFLIIWLIVLTALIVVGFLMVIGKFARVGRGQQELVNEVLDDEGYSKIEEIHGVINAALEDFKTSKTEIENLKIQTGATQETFVGQMGNVTNQISGLIETQTRLHDMIEKGYEDRPVTAALPAVSSVHNSKGGRPRKGG
jgi:hypothetical protein